MDFLQVDTFTWPGPQPRRGPPPAPRHPWSRLPSRPQDTTGWLCPTLTYICRDWNSLCVFFMASFPLRCVCLQGSSSGRGNGLFVCTACHRAPLRDVGPSQSSATVSDVPESVQVSGGRRGHSCQQVSGEGGCVPGHVLGRLRPALPDRSRGGGGAHTIMREHVSVAPLLCRLGAAL